MSREHDHIVIGLRDLCGQLGADCLIQVGAEDGFESYVCADVVPRVICIEADERCIPMHPDLEFHHLMIGATDARVPFYIHQEMGLSSSIERKDGREQWTTARQYRLDTFCRMKGGILPDSLIIDTEGTTMQVLKGCGDLLSGVKLIYAECQNEKIRPGVSLFEEVDNFLKASGMALRHGHPSYDAGCQSNYTWVRE